MPDRTALAGAPPDTCAVVISTETESGFITEDDTSPVCHTPKLPEVTKTIAKSRDARRRLLEKVRAHQGAVRPLKKNDENLLHSDLSPTIFLFSEFN
ncbi:hypothetical protein TNCV_4606781 [Trichonephila clavipes]|nr:hypothetical protein TNCV_4606781 [Trichonephila clavipes]